MGTHLCSRLRFAYRSTVQCRREAALLHRFLDGLLIAGDCAGARIVLPVDRLDYRQCPLGPLQRPREVPLCLER